MAFEIHAVKSKALTQLGYDPETKKMYVEFTSHETGYYDHIPETVYEMINSSTSKGHSLHELVKKFPDKYPYRKL